MEGEKGVEYVERSLKRVMDYIRKKSAGGLTVLKIIETNMIMLVASATLFRHHLETACAEWEFPPLFFEGGDMVKF
jgi:hypothetical protein